MGNGPEASDGRDAELDAASPPIMSRKNRLASAQHETELRAKIAAAVLAGDDAEAARLLAMLGRPPLRVVR